MYYLVHSNLAAEAVEGPALPLQGVDHAHGMLGVGNSVADDILEEDLEDAADLLIDEAGDPLDAAPPRQAADGGLGVNLARNSYRKAIIKTR